MNEQVTFTEAEVRYLSAQKLGRVATVSKKGIPHVVPVSYSLQNNRIVFDGYGFESSLKFKHIQNNPNIAFVVDSVRLNPWTPLGIEVRGRARIITLEGGKKAVEIIPEHKASWGLN